MRTKALTDLKRSSVAFTLAELLIALAILGVIATFTIPKILTSQKNGKLNAIAKESMGSIATAFQKHQQAGRMSASTIPPDLTQYMNYVSVDTSSGSFDGTGFGCGSGEPCLLLHNGSVLEARWPGFGGSATTNALSFYIDPDASTPLTGGLEVFIYYNGRMTTNANTLPNTCTAEGCSGAGFDPAWFSWN